MLHAVDALGGAHEDGHVRSRAFAPSEKARSTISVL
jgi:hypothetical protein